MVPPQNNANQCLNEWGNPYFERLLLILYTVGMFLYLQ